MRTFAELTGATTPEKIDGISILHTFLGKEDEQEKHEYLYWEFYERGGRKAIRQGDWKPVNYNINNPKKTTMQLYNIANDHCEENNLAEENPGIVKELTLLMDTVRTDSEVYTFR